MSKNKKDYLKYMEVFLDANSKLNLISKNDEKLLWEKHIFDSLAIEKFFKGNYKCLKDNHSLKLLDIGTGGGFPSLPIAITYPEIQVYALDSIRKKINAIDDMKTVLNLQNLHPICERVENLKGQKFDIITSRAVAPLKVITSYAAPLLKKGGCFIAYKSRRAEEEIAEAKTVFKKFGLKVIDIIEYDLPLEENHIRNLIVIG